MKNIVQSICMAMAAAWLSGCGDLEFFEAAKNIVSDPSVTVTTRDGLAVEDEWETDRKAQEIVFRVHSNADWTASVDNAARSWCNVNPPSAHGNDRLLVRLKYNENAESRKATVRIAYDENVYAEFDLLQKGAPLIDRHELTVAKFKSVNRIVVAATETWTTSVRYPDGGNWCELSVTGGERGTFQIDLTTESNPDGPRSAYVDIVCGDITETLEISQLGDFETLTATVDKGADTLRVAWNKIIGATAYRISATRSGSAVDLGHIDVDTSKTAYDFFPVEGNLFADYVGIAEVTVEALTADPGISPIRSVPVSTHTLYDDASGNGTSTESAFIISTRRHLANVKYHTSSIFRQTAHIDMAGFDDDLSAANGNFTPIPVFSGVYNGDNFEIRNLSVSLTGTASTFVAPILSLSGNSESPAELNGIILVDPVISNLATAAVTCPTGGLVAQIPDNTYARIIDCVIKGGSISASNAHTVGGLIGQALSGCQLISGCANEGCSVTGSNGVGGIAGRSSAISMIDCHNTGTIHANNYGGGLCGNLVQPGNISYCYNKGNIISGSKANPGTGGIVGRAYGNNSLSCTIEGCFNTGSIFVEGLTGAISHGVGGIAGVLNHANTFVRNCYNTGEIVIVAIGKEGCGGIIGTSANNTKSDNILVNCYNVGRMSNGYGVIGNVTHTATTISGNYYLETIASAGAATLTSGFTALSDEKMRELSNFEGWDPQEWKQGDATYPYPQLINNPHK